MNKTRLISSLLRLYAIVMITIITLFTMVVGYTVLRKAMTESQNENVQAAKFMTETINHAEQQTEVILSDLLGDGKKIENLYAYFSLDPSQYLEKTLQNNTTELLYWPQMIKQMYYQQLGIAGIRISLNEFDALFYSDQTMKAGQKLKKLPKHTNQIEINRSIIHPDNIKSTGTFTMIVDDAIIKKNIEETNGTDKQTILVYTDSGQLMYRYNGEKNIRKSGDKSYADYRLLHNQRSDNVDYVTEAESRSGLEIVVLTPKSLVYQQAFQDFIWLLIGSLLIDGVLLVILFRTFGSYGRQVEDIKITMNKVTESQLEIRINEASKKNELKDIAVGINQMLDDINQQVKAIYVLEINQKEAELRALQSQINPHFLYNTLEYIRMYALSEGVEELADVVYAFASLLRNNTMQEKHITLQQELVFCEKYVYLYQMRYPDRVAYNFTIAEDVTDVIIPKFLVQPLVENYFVHGIDFTRIDNAMSVKVYRKESRIFVDVIDNGRGVDETNRHNINQLLASETKINGRAEQSIGLMNVNNRLKLYYPGFSQMRLLQHKSGGLHVQLSFEEDSRDV